MDRKIKLGFTFTPIPKYNGIDINQLNSIVSKIPTKWDASMANLNKQINTTKTTQPNNLVNRVFKGLSNKTSGTYYDANGNLLFKDGQLTDAGKQLFGKNAQRAEWNMRSGNVFQNNSWRADNTTFDFKNMKALDGYQDKYKQMNGRWVFKDSDGKWTYFNQYTPVVKNTKQTQPKQTNPKQTNQQAMQIDDSGFVTPVVSNKDEWDVFTKLNGYTPNSLLNKWAYKEKNTSGKYGTQEKDFSYNDDNFKDSYIKWYLNNAGGYSPTGAIIPSVYDSATQGYDKFMKKYYVSNPDINKNTWVSDLNITPKYIHKGVNLALVNSSDHQKAQLRNVNGNLYLFDENGNNGIQMVDRSTGNQNFYMQETNKPQKYSVKYNNKYYNVYIPSNKSGGKLIKTNNKFENWINGTK